MSPTIEANDFELRPALVSFVEKDQFGGRPTENPNIHLHNFLAKCDTSKLYGSPQMQSDWGSSHSRWKTELVSKCILLSKTARPREEITSFAQRDDESLHEAW